MPRHDPHSDGSVLAEIRHEAKEPPLYKVLLHNDDYTSMEFVVNVLQNVFRKAPADAVNIMLAVHRSGIGVAGVYPAQVAETKIETVHEMAREEGFPLRLSMEPE